MYGTADQTSTMARLAMALLAGFLVVGLFSQTVHNNSHNEQMYVTAGYLLAHGQRLYQDFAFVQTPYSPLVYALAFRLTNGHYLMTAKLVNFAFFATAAILLYAIARRETRDRLFSLTVLALYLANYYLLRSVIEASNYTIPIASTLAAYYLFLRYIDNPKRAGAYFCAGLLLGAAVGAKLYYATLVIPFGLAALLYPATTSLRSRISSGVLPMAGGAIVGALALLYYAVRDWDRFAFNNLGYHLLNAQWRERNGFTATMTWATKLDTARDLLANPSYLLIVAWLALAVAVVLTQSVRPLRRFSSLAPGIVLSGILVIVSLLTAFTPRPLFPQYFAMPVPFLLTLMAALYAQMAQPYRRTLRQAAVIAAVLLTITVLPRHTGSLRRAAAGQSLGGCGGGRNEPHHPLPDRPHKPSRRPLARLRHRVRPVHLPGTRHRLLRLPHRRSTQRGGTRPLRRHVSLHDPRALRRQSARRHPHRRRRRPRTAPPRVRTKPRL